MLHIRRVDVEDVDVAPQHLPAVLRILDHILLGRVARDEASLRLGVDGEVLAHVGFAEQLFGFAVEGGGVDVGAAALLEDVPELGQLVLTGEGSLGVDARGAEDCWEAAVWHCEVSCRFRSGLCE